MASLGVVEAKRWRTRKLLTVQKHFPRQPYLVRNTFVVELGDGTETCEPESPGARSAPGTCGAWSSGEEPCWDEDPGSEGFDSKTPPTSEAGRADDERDLVEVRCMKSDPSLLCVRGRGPERLVYDKEIADEGSFGCSARATSPQQPICHSIGGIFGALKQEDPQCVIMVRGIHKLGLGCEGVLEEHFSRFGPVAKALLVHSNAPKWRARKNGGASRVRQGNFGFVVMEGPCGVDRILQVGKEQMVAWHVVIVVERFNATLCR